MIRPGHPIALLAALAALSATGPVGCQSAPVEEQRKMVVHARGDAEAYDALSAVLVQRFENIDPEATSRERGEVVTTWRKTEEPQRLVRVRARGWVRPAEEKDRRTVEVQVERQFSSAKTDFGELERQRPTWVGGGDTADVTLEREILLAVRQRLSGPIQNR